MIYLLVLIITFYLANKYFILDNGNTSIGKKQYLWLCILVALIAGLRFYVGADTANYVEDFKHIPTLDRLNIASFSYSRYRPGYIVLTSVCKSIWNNFLLLQLVVACFSNLVIFNFVWKRSTSPFLTILFYFILNYIEFNFEIMREVTAVSFALLAVDFFEKKKYLYACVWVVIANLMHASAIVVMLYPLLSFIKYSKKTILISSVLALSIFSLYQIIPDISIYADLFFGYGDYGERYLSRDISQEYNWHAYVMYFLRYFILPIIAIVFAKNRFKYPGFVVVWMLFGLLSITSYAFYRFNNYLVPFVWILYSEAFVVITKKIGINKGLMMICAMVTFFYIYQRTLFSIDDYHGGYHIYERYFPYDMVSPDQDYNYSQSQYIIRR